jgi:hypothetical protein
MFHRIIKRVHDSASHNLWDDRRSPIKFGGWDVRLWLSECQAVCRQCMQVWTTSDNEPGMTILGPSGANDKSL